MTLYHRSAKPFSKQSVNKSLKRCYDDFHKQEISKLPRRRFLRKKGSLKIDVLADFASAEETRDADDFCIDWMPHVLDLLIAEIKQCRPRFNETDFQIDDFIEFLDGLHDKLPSTKKAAKKMDKAWRDFYHAGRERMSEWEKLGIDFDEFHHSAKLVVNDPRLWSTGHDFAPNGNDNGADLMSLFRKQKSRINKNGGHAFLKKMARDWGFDVSCKPDDSIEYRLKREVVVGLAFAFMKSFSYCPKWLLEQTKAEVLDYKSFLQTNHLDWSYRSECEEYQDLILSCLDKCPTEQA